ncbi:phosphotransferase [Ornithinimicrobium sp. F0845]|uniref:phosphotransferase enzyme family protein n=1 Tax=Ornithinimicrobium sp. F0845 TaxID=2926412 RepID=UPI001FF1DE84|nr:phosphotransferase [Ornithinimicrobium sp. F0845]MCK0112976.1 phosphotransferase [Ornithinimicrobium sp. F0845]
MTVGAGYHDLTDEEQAEALRPVALEAAACFGLEVHRLEVLLHAYNTTYSLETVTGERFALRINTNSTSDGPEIATQQAWQLALAEHTPVQVATPRRTVDGQWCASVASPALERELRVTCASWLEGDDVGDPSPEVARELGRAMALMHQQARTWELPDGGRMPLFDTPLFGDPDLLDTADLQEDQHEVLRIARTRTEEAFRRQYAGAPVIALHADLHGGNLKWHDGRLAVFDFDDCGLGIPALDLAISTFYLRGDDEAPEVAMRAGYASIAPLPEVSTEDFEAIVASRQLLLANSILASSTTQLRAMARTYLPATVDRLRHWLETGHFTRQLGG